MGEFTPFRVFDLDIDRTKFLLSVVPHIVAQDVCVDFGEVRKSLRIPEGKELHIVADLDCTLREEYNEHIDPRIAKHLQRQLGNGAIASLTIASNHRADISRFAGEIAPSVRVYNPPIIDGQVIRKPKPAYYQRILTNLDIEHNENAVLLTVGDKVWRDVRGGNRLKQFSMLVQPFGNVTSPEDRFFLRPFDNMMKLCGNSWYWWKTRKHRKAASGTKPLAKV